MWGSRAVMAGTAIVRVRAAVRLVRARPMGSVEPVKTTKQTFGRDPRAAVPRVRVVRAREAEEHCRLYRGIGLRERS